MVHPEREESVATDDEAVATDDEAKVSFLLRAAPGIVSLQSLLEIDPFTLSQSARIDYLAAMERQTSWLQAAIQRAIDLPYGLVTPSM